MALYEHVFLARQDLAQGQVDALAETATKIVEENEGKVTKVETWGLRSLAYKIAKNRKAHYVMLNIDAPAGVVAELERQTQINEDIIRYMTIKVEDVPNILLDVSWDETGEVSRESFLVEIQDGKSVVKDTLPAN